MGFFLSSIGLRLSAIGIATLMAMGVWGWIYSKGYSAAVQRVTKQEQRTNAKARAARSNARANPQRVLEPFFRD